MENSCALILAGGKGKRMGSTMPKVLFKVLGKPMINWVLSACNKAQIKDICVLLGHKANEVRNNINIKAEFAFQQEQKGTADAVKCARSFLEKNIEKDVFICCADSPLLTEDIIKKAYKSHKKGKYSATIITAKTENKKGLGRILRDGERILKIVEEKDATKQELNINEVNSGAYWFRVKDLLNVLNKITFKNVQNEYYLTDAIQLLLQEDKMVSGFLSLNENLVFGVNSKLELLKVNEIARINIIKEFIKKGVEFINIDGILIYPNVKIGANTLILPGTIINESYIGEGCKIGPNSLIEASKIGNFCKINSSQVYSSNVEDYTTIGPFCHIRPNSNISHNVKIGDFVEVKNSNIGAGTSISHLTYVGDSDVGKNVNFGCGVVTINYDGVNKHRCLIEDGAFIGCNTNLVAPVKLGKNAYTGAGSTISKDVEDNALAIERAKQVNVKNFSKKKLAGRKLKVKE